MRLRSTAGVPRPPQRTSGGCGPPGPCGPFFVMEHSVRGVRWIQRETLYQRASLPPGGVRCKAAPVCVSPTATQVHVSRCCPAGAPAGSPPHHRTSAQFITGHGGGGGGSHMNGGYCPSATGAPCPRPWGWGCRGTGVSCRGRVGAPPVKWGPIGLSGGDPAFSLPPQLVAAPPGSTTRGHRSCVCRWECDALTAPRPCPGGVGGLDWTPPPHCNTARGSGGGGTNARRDASTAGPSPVG